MDDGVRTFEPADWLKAHRDGDDPATTGANFDAAKLKKAVVDFYKEDPKHLITPPWLSNLKHSLGRGTKSVNVDLETAVNAKAIKVETTGTNVAATGAENAATGAPICG